MQAGAVWKEETSIEELPLSDLHIGKCGGHFFLDQWLEWKADPIVDSTTLSRLYWIV